MADTVVYGIPNCDTVKRARAWLSQQGVAHQFHDFKKAGLAPALLQGWVNTLGWDVLLNRRGTTWRQLTAEQQESAQDAASAQALMLEHTSLVKRPVVAWGDGSLTVGFDENAWSLQMARFCAP
jgi:arsenate reductase (glutaredoxin)